MPSPDTRIPIRFESWSTARRGEMILATAAVPAPEGVGMTIWSGEHGTSCPCCGGRSRLAEVLSSLFVSAMRGERAHFSALVADLDDIGNAALRDALRTDRFLAARYVAHSLS